MIAKRKPFDINLESYLKILVHTKRETFKVLMFMQRSSRIGQVIYNL